MDARISPTPGELEREAILRALSHAVADGGAPGYDSAWRDAALRESAGLVEDDGVAQTGRPRSARGATRA